MPRQGPPPCRETNSYTGVTTVTGGTLEVGDINNPNASLAGDVTVASGGTLAGHGMVGGDVDNMYGGTVSPGGSIGTLFVGGNYVQGSASTLAIEVSPTAASKLVVGAAATLSGTLALTYDPGVYTAKTYTIVQAASVTGTFNTVTSTAPSGFDQSVDSSATDVILSLSRSYTVAPTHTGILPASSVVTLAGGQTANSLLFSHLARAGDDTQTGNARAALAQPVQLASAGDNGQLAQVLASLPQAVTAIGGWVRATGGLGSVKANAETAGYDTAGGGFLAGLDREVTDHLIAGVAAGYSRDRLFSHGVGSGTLDSPRLMTYGSYAFDSVWAADASLGYAYDRISTVRNTPTGRATASHWAHEGTAEAELRANLSTPGGVRLTPAAGLRYVALTEQGYLESGASGNNLAVASRTSQSVQPFAALAVERTVTDGKGVTWTPRASLEYARELVPAQSTALTVGGGSFTAAAVEPSRDRVTAGLGLDAHLNNALALSVDYRSLLPTGNAVAHTVSATLHYTF